MPCDLFYDWDERRHQVELLKWATKEIARGRESLKLLGAIPNGKMQLSKSANFSHGQLGFKSGIPDLFFLRPINNSHGLFIELKSLSDRARVSGLQSDFFMLLRQNGYSCIVCYGYREAISAINIYEGIV